MVTTVQGSEHLARGVSHFVRPRVYTLSMSRTTETQALYTWALDHASYASKYAELMRAWRDDLATGEGYHLEHARLRLSTARRLYQSGVPLDDALRRAHQEHHGG